MSIEAIHFIMKTEIPDGIAKLVAFVIADYAHAETGHAWPKVETLARKCSQSVRTVQRKIRALEELGVLRVEQRHAENGRQRENLFVLYLPGVPRPAANDLVGARPAGGKRQGEGDTQSPIPPVGSVTPGGDTPDTPEGDTAVTPRGIPQKESTRRESPRGENPDRTAPPASADAATAPKGAPPPRAITCPDDFAPGAGHYAIAEAAGLDAAFVRQTAAKMVRWSRTNAHRPIARKADWDLAFDAFLETEIREAAERAARGSHRAGHGPPAPRRSSNGALSILADVYGVPDDPRPLYDQLFGAAGGDPVDGSVRGTVHEPPGRSGEWLPAPTDATLRRAGR